MNIKDTLTLNEYIQEQSKPKLVEINPYYPLTLDEYNIIKYLSDADKLVRDEYGHLSIQYKAISSEKAEPYIISMTFSMFDKLFKKVTHEKPLNIKHYLATINK